MGFGAIIGGALTGLGKGIAEQGAENARARSAMALEELRAKRDSEKLVQTADLQDRNATRSDARTDYYEARKTERDTGSKLKVGITLENARAANDRAMESMKQNFQSNQSAIEFGRKTAEEARRAGELIDRYETAEDGSLIGITQTGKIYRSSVKLAPRNQYSPGAENPDEGGTLAGARERREGGGIGSAAAAPPPRTTATQQVKPKPQVQTQPTYSAAEAAATAKARGIPIAQVHAMMRANGYKLTN